MRPLFATLLSTALLVSGCGGSSTPAKSSSEKKGKKADVASSEKEANEGEAEDEEEEETGQVPTKCAGKGSYCTPSLKFVKRLCEDSYPALALVMFAGGTPWTRGYVAVRKVESINAFGGMSGGDDLVLHEEVLVLFENVPDLGGMQVSGSGSYQVLRWNGTCATLAEGELRLERPGRPKHAKVVWRYLEEGIQEALRNKDERITEVYRARRKECKGATMGTVSDKCEKFDKQLTQTIVDVVREGGIDFPTPRKMP